MNCAQASHTHHSGFFFGHAHEQNIYTLGTIALLLSRFFFSFGIPLLHHTCHIFRYLVSKHLNKKRRRIITFSLNSIPTTYIFIYIVSIPAFSFIVDCMDVGCRCWFYTVGFIEAGYLFAKPYAAQAHKHKHTHSM